jgi:hypothetical protein
MNFINATVLQKNNNNFVCNPCGGYGVDMPVPAGSQSTVGAEYWAVPVKDDFLQGFKYDVYHSGVAAPTIDSIRCFKVTNLLNSDYYMVVGTIAQYEVYAAACCDASPIPSYLTTLPTIAPCQETCTSDGTNYDAFFAVQSLEEITPGTPKYVATVNIGGVGVYQQTYGTGSTSIGALITILNTRVGAGFGTFSNPAGNTIRFRTTSAKTICFIGCIKTS